MYIYIHVYLNTARTIPESMCYLSISSRHEVRMVYATRESVSINMYIAALRDENFRTLEMRKTRMNQLPGSEIRRESE